MAGANGLSSKSGPAKAKSLNVVKLYRGKGERVVFTTNEGAGRALMSNSKGEMRGMTAEEGRQRIANLTSPAGGFKVKAPRRPAGSRSAAAASGAPSAKTSRSLDKAIARGQKNFRKRAAKEADAKRGITNKTKNQLDALLKKNRAA